MTKEEITRLAREAGFVGMDGDHGALRRFASLVAAAEREALEKINWTALIRQDGLVTWGDAETLADRVIAAIRARSKT